MARDLGTLRTQHDTHLKAIKGRFNVFTILLGMGDEPRLHSRWLVHLLNPESTHDCGPLFLDLFVRSLEKNVQAHTDDTFLPRDLLGGFECKSAKVRTEVAIDDGRLDILIECPGWGVIAIENKIWAAEQPLQISRYANYLDKSCKPTEKFLLLYLTLEGTPSQEAGTFAERYYRISYRDHIRRWLEECLQATYQHININQALQQYKSVVSHLLGNNYESAYMEKVIELLKGHPEIIKDWSEINSAIEQMKERYLKGFIEALRKHLSPTIELGPQERFNDRIDFYFSDGKHSIKIDNEINVRFLIQWQVGTQILRIGAFLTVEEKRRVDVWAIYQKQFEIVRERLKNEHRQFVYGMEPSEWWPLGAVDLVTRFITNEFLAENACNDSAALEDQVKPVADLIVAYLNASKTYIEEAIAGTEYPKPV